MGAASGMTGNRLPGRPCLSWSRAALAAISRRREIVRPTGIAITREGSALRIVFENRSAMVEIRASAAMWARWAVQVADAAELAGGGGPSRPGAAPAGGPS
jgi:hypothetical protein